ncbi:hypothetical protein JCM10213_008724 [Rhodosporidiobolus nylandii]
MDDILHLASQLGDYLRRPSLPRSAGLERLEGVFDATDIKPFDEYLSDLPSILSSLKDRKSKAYLKKGNSKPDAVVVVLDRVAIELPKPSTTKSGEPNCHRFLRILHPDLKSTLAHERYKTNSSDYGTSERADVLVDEVEIPSFAPFLLNGVAGSFADYCFSQSPLGQAAWEISGAGSFKPRVFSQHLVLRPVFHRPETSGSSDGERLQVRFELGAACFLSPVAMCERELAKL